MTKTDFRLPRGGEHTTIVGRTGSGKSLMGAYLTSRKRLKARPHIVIDYKGEEFFNRLTRIRPIGFEIPEHGGLYILHARPDQHDEMESWMWDVWATGDVDILIDEGYMLPNERAFLALLTQGRSKRIPVTTLSQRPVEINRFAFSEASHVIVFDLNDERDEKTVAGFTPKGFTRWFPKGVKGDRSHFDTRAMLLPAYHSRWWNVPDRTPHFLQPVPDAETLLADIDAQLDPRLKWF